MNSIKRIKKKYLWISLGIFVGYYVFSMTNIILYESNILPAPNIFAAVIFVILIIVVFVTRVNYLKSALFDYQASFHLSFLFNGITLSNLAISLALYLSKNLISKENI